ncbi:MAG TPA: MotA/TolQ/ExbB proton channel family protein [Solirubrobacteraceae bacterium]|nr:MotA/TolQ/ExbB proton channel family protein [Solirubrobacteraceae bacterium]
MSGVGASAVVASLDGALADALARLAAALRVPVLLIALAVLLAAALELGRFGAELWLRRVRRRHGSLRELAVAVVREPGRAGVLAGYAPTAFATQALRELALAQLHESARPIAVEHALADYELAAQRSLDRTRILVRVGPAIGLMGTLIPLAPGLAALGRGDVPALASDLRTAFAATVIGLLVGTVAFALTLTRTRFYTEDLTALERAVAFSARGREPSSPPSASGRGSVS